MALSTLERNDRRARLMDLLTFASAGNYNFIGDPAFFVQGQPDPRERWKDTSVGDTIEFTHIESGRRFQFDNDGRGGRYVEVE